MRPSIPTTTTAPAPNGTPEAKACTDVPVFLLLPAMHRGRERAASNCRRRALSLLRWQEGGRRTTGSGSARRGGLRSRPRRRGPTAPRAPHARSRTSPRAAASGRRRARRPARRTSAARRRSRSGSPATAPCTARSGRVRAAVRGRRRGRARRGRSCSRSRLPSLLHRPRRGGDVGRTTGAVVIGRERLVGGGLDELLEERAVMTHRLAEILRRLAVVRRLRRQPVADPVVLDDLRMVDGYVRGALLEVLHRVAAIRHHRLDQAVRARDGGARIVDELRLHGPPACDVPILGSGRERPDVEVPAALLPCRKLLLGRARAVGLLRDPLVLRAEPLAQLRAPALRQGLPDDHGDDNDDGDRDHRPYPSGHRYTSLIACTGPPVLLRGNERPRGRDTRVRYEGV